MRLIMIINQNGGYNYKPDSTGLYIEIQQIFQLIFSKAKINDNNNIIY